MFCNSAPPAESLEGMDTSQTTTAARSPLGALNRPVAPPSRRTVVWLAIAAVLLGAAWGCWHWLNHPPRPWLVRWRLERFLKKEARTGDFKTAFAFPAKELMDTTPALTPGAGAPAKGRETGLDFDALRDEYFTLKTAAVILDRDLSRHAENRRETTARLDELTRQLAAGTATNASELESNATVLRTRLAGLQQEPPAKAELKAKETALIPVERDLWEFQRGWRSEAEATEATTASQFAKVRNDFAARIRQQHQSAGSYPEMYRLVGQQLWVARQLLDARNPDIVRAGITTALEAAKHALNDAQNGWVAARICEGYIWPRLDVADDTNRRSPFNPENLLRECADIFQRNNEYNNVVRTYHTYLDRAGTPARKDWARAQISNAYRDAGDIKNAVKYLKQIQDTNDNRWVLRQLPMLERQLKAQ